MDPMADGECVFESVSKPMTARTFLLAGLGCAGFWFFDYAVRGWLGGTPNLAVSLRHTFVIAVCLAFLAGFFVRGGRKVRVTKEGIAVTDAMGRIAQIAWKEITEARAERGRLVFHGGKGRLSISLHATDQEGFLRCLETFAGPKHPLTESARQAMATLPVKQKEAACNRQPPSPNG